MKIIRKEISRKLSETELKYLDENTCLLDIETTGLSPNYCHIYMIGLARITCGIGNIKSRDNISVEITLLFAEDTFEEEDILREFSDYSKNTAQFITFNGLTFDFPFIKSRFNKYGIEYDYKKYEQIDIFKKCKGLKRLLKLDNLKQKTIESFLGIERNDTYSGGELIEQYKTYIKTGDKELYNNLITHNLEDVQGMVDLLVILRYTDIVDIINKEALPEVICNEKEIKATLPLKCTLPKRLVLRGEYHYIIFEKDTVNALLSPKDSTMKYFLPNFRDYSYLANEDIIVPNQLLNPANKKNAVPAKKENCFVEKRGLFLPVLDKTMFEEDKLYRESYSDKEYYIDLKDNANDSVYIRNYILHIIKNEAT